MVYILIAEGFEEIEALAVADILRRANIKTILVSVDNKSRVTGAHGISIETDVNISDISDDYKVLFLPGGYPGYENLEKNEKVKELIIDAYNNKKIIAAICAAPSILGHLNLLDGRDACCFPSFEKELIGANVSFDDVVCSDNIITSRGAGTAHKLGFKLVEILTDAQTAQNLSKTMIF